MDVSLPYIDQVSDLDAANTLLESELKSAESADTLRRLKERYPLKDVNSSPPEILEKNFEVKTDEDFAELNEQEQEELINNMKIKLMLLLRQEEALLVAKDYEKQLLDTQVNVVEKLNKESSSQRMELDLEALRLNRERKAMQLLAKESFEKHEKEYAETLKRCEQLKALLGSKD